VVNKLIKPLIGNKDTIIFTWFRNNSIINDENIAVSSKIASVYYYCIFEM